MSVFGLHVDVLVHTPQASVELEKTLINKF